MTTTGPTDSDSPKTVSRSTLAFLSGTFLSRISGFGRDMAMAVAFGSNPAIAAFMVAFRFSNLIRRLFGEGSLSSGFIPHFEQVRSQSPEKGARFFRDLFFSLGAFLVLLIIILEVVLCSVLHWGHLTPDNAQILYLTAVMLPGILFICLFGLSSSLLQCERRYFMTGFAPVAFNLVWIAATLYLKDLDPSVAVLPLSIAVIIGFFVQWLMLAPRTFLELRRSLSWKECLSPGLFPKELRSILKPFLLGIIGVGAVQINSTLDAVFARCATLEGPAYLWYAIRIEQLPLALFGIALSAALLPPLSRALKSGAHEQYLRLLHFAMRRAFSLIFPCSFAIFVLGLTGINLCYGHGDFSTEATRQTVICLWGYGLGLLPAVFVILLAPAFYANKEFRIPMMGSTLSVIFNIFLTSLFVFVLHWGAFSIAIATSLAAWFNSFYLCHHLAKKIQAPLFDRVVLGSFLKTGICTLIAAIATLFLGSFFVGDATWKLAMGEPSLIFPRDIKIQTMQFVALCGTFLLLFYSYAWMFHAEDALELIGVRRKIT